MPAPSNKKGHSPESSDEEDPIASALTPAERQSLLEEGIALFREQKYQAAHEGWEAVWKSAVEPERTHLKALIQVCGILHLIGEKRFDPALRLCMRSLELFSEAEAHYQMHGGQPELRIPGIEDVVLRIAAALKVGMHDAGWFLDLASTLSPALRARNESDLRRGRNELLESEARSDRSGSERRPSRKNCRVPRADFP